MLLNMNLCAIKVCKYSIMTWTRLYPIYYWFVICFMLYDNIVLLYDIDAKFSNGKNFFIFKITLVVLVAYYTGVSQYVCY
jgi:hypothetical protein